MSIIRADGLSKCFRLYRRSSDRVREFLGFGGKALHEPFWAVRDVDLEVERGSCLGIIGENGSGKSTLLRLIAGVVRPTSGTVGVDGRVSALLELGAGFNPQFTGRENVFLNAAILGFSDLQTRERLPAIEKFAEIGDFVDRPVKTYSSGMFVRLAFAVAIHLDPDILVVDEALSVGDFYFQQRCIRRIQQMKQQGVTIVFVSHDLDAVRVLADRAVWMDHGRVRLEGKTNDVVARYVAAIAGRSGEAASGKDAEIAAGRSLTGPADLEISQAALARMPAYVSAIPNVDHRYGNGHARVDGIGVFSAEGSPATVVAQGDRICVRISVQFLKDVARPNVGFIVRNRLGQDVTGTNVMFEGEQLAPARAGDLLSVDFVMDLPFLHSGFYHFSPAVADGELSQYEMCDWIDNACAVELTERSATYGHIRIPTRVRAFSVLPEVGRMKRSSVEF